MAEKFKKQFTCLGENTEKCIIFTVPVEKEITKIDKNGKEIIKNIFCIVSIATVFLKKQTLKIIQ